MCGNTQSKKASIVEYWIHEDPDKRIDLKESFGYNPFEEYARVRYYSRTPRGYTLYYHGILSMFQIISNTNTELSKCEEWLIPRHAVNHYYCWANKVGLSSIDIVQILILLARAQVAYQKKSGESFFIYRYYHIVAATYISQSMLYDQPLSKISWHDCLAAWMTKDDQYPNEVDYIYGSAESFERLKTHVFHLLELIDYNIYYTPDEFNHFSEFMNYDSLAKKLRFVDKETVPKIIST